MELNRHNIDICGISETKKKGQGTSQYSNYILAYSGKKKEERAHSGVGILIHERYEQHIDDIEYINDRILRVSLKLENRIYHFISTYAPDITKPKEDTDNFYYNMQALFDKLPDRGGVIILGDLNARIGDCTINGVKQRYNESVLNDNGEALIDFCARNELRINNTFFPHKEQHKYTFVNSRGEKSIINFIITNRTIQPTQILDVRALTSANIGTDHHLILCKLRIKKPIKRIKPAKYIEKYNVESLEEDSTKTLYENRLSGKISQNNILESDNVNQAWEKI
jgi:exonuclease III